jgi:hypothetical protein
MYSILFTIFFSCIIIFFVYKFYPIFDRFIKRFLPNERVTSIKSDMRKLDEISIKNSEYESESKIDNIYQKIDKIIYSPIVFFKKILVFYFPNLGKD